MENFDYKELLNYKRRRNISFSEYVDAFLEEPGKYLHTSSTLIAEAIKHFGFKIVIRSGEPVFSYNSFEDPFFNGVNAVYGQEFCIKKVVSVIESLSKESGPNRGIVLLGPPASGKTNIVDLITLALEQYTKEREVKLYSFFYRFRDVNDNSRVVDIRSSFMHNPILFFTTILQKDSGITKPRRELFRYIKQTKGQDIRIPTYYQNASLDKRSLDILESILQNPRNAEKTLFDVLEEYVRVEEIEFSNAQAMGISNIDDMKKLSVFIKTADTRAEAVQILNEHLPTKFINQYEGPLVSCNRGILHIHDAFGTECGESIYKPLLMLLGSGKVSLEASQTAIDSVVIVTTNLEDMEYLDKQLTSSKLLDRIEKIPANYLLDANSEMDILRRDMSIIKERYEVDPNLFRIAAYFSVMTRLLPPLKKNLPAQWPDDKKRLFHKISPEQKLFIYSCHSDDPVSVIQKLPFWHPFRNEASKLGIDLEDTEQLIKHIAFRSDNISLEGSLVFTREELKLIDEEFMRELLHEHKLIEGKHGISIRQLQNIMRKTISTSNGRNILVSSFINQLFELIQEGSSLHHWLSIESKYKKNREPIPPRTIGKKAFRKGEGDYGDYEGLVKVVQAVYLNIVRREIINCTVDRDPKQIELDLRKYTQYALLAQAVENKAFAHIMIPRFSFIDPITGEKVESPDTNYMNSIEQILCSNKNKINFRREIAQKFFDFQDSNKLRLETGKTLINSRNDDFTACFEKEYNLLLSHRKPDDGINGEHLNELFFQKQNDPKKYDSADSKLKQLAENIIENMKKRFNYSDSIAHETILYALRLKVIDFKEILN